MPTPTVFISYSHKDERWKELLRSHLGVLEQEGLLKIWSDEDIVAGDEWFEAIQAAMKAAKVAVFLVSADSLNSKFIRHEEIPRLLERREKEGMTFLPVVVRACVWEELPWLARFQARPKNGKPLAGLPRNRFEEEISKIAKEILGILRNGSSTSPPSKSENPSLGSVLTALYQLPTPPTDFTGREEDLAVLRSALTQGGMGGIFGLRGMGGVGKTTLALKLAEELAPLYPDAQLYLDLKGVDPQPLTAAQAMAHVIRSWHPDARLPETEAELAPLYRSVIHGKQVLLLMDNAGQRGREQIEPLIPPTGSLLLVTSRFHFSVPGIIARDLDELSQEDARNLLLRIAPRIAAEADEISRLCGRLPLALRLAGSALDERKDLSPAEYARRLREGKERLGPVEASLSVSYELLAEPQRRLWRLLAVFPSTFDAQAAAAVWELEIDPAQDALSDLIRCSLIEWEEKDERYRLHDLARISADGRLQGEERGLAQRKHASHFLKVFADADDLYQKGGKDIGRALRLFDQEWNNIQAGQAWAAGRVLEEDEAARICSDYPDRGPSLFNLRHPREQIRWIEAALVAARHQKDRLSENHNLGNLGLAFYALGEPQRAIELYEQQLAIAREIGDRKSECNGLGNMGNAYNSLGESRRAIEFYEQHLAAAREIGDRNGEGYALGNMGLAYANLGESQRAIGLYRQTLAIAREVGDRRSEGRALGNLGVAYTNLGEPQRAIELYEQWRVIACEIGDRRGEAAASWNLGLAMEREGDLARAVDLMQIRVDFLLAIGHPDAEKDAQQVEAIRVRIAKHDS